MAAINGLNPKSVYALLRREGRTDLIDELRGVKPITLTRRDAAQVAKKLNEDGMVVLRRVTSNPSNWEFVSPKFVTLQPRRHLEKKAQAKQAVESK